MNIEAALKNLDSPIQSFQEDLLQRRGFVENLCRMLEVPSPDESTVFALHGEWGAGKTSVKNLLKQAIVERGENAAIPIEFNPWAFSAQDQILEAFFSEVSKAIDRGPAGKDAAAGFKKLGAYLSFGSKTAKTLHVGMDLFGIPGAKLVGVFGEHMEGTAKSSKEFGKDIDSAAAVSLEEVQKGLRAALKKLRNPLLVILDDLDRLTPEQLLLVFQIVKVNASLPRVNFLLLMDWESTVNRLEEKGLGPEYLEKIVQIEISLPHVPSAELKIVLKSGFEVVMGRYVAQIDWDRWEEAWTNGLQNLFVTLRRIKRFLQTLTFNVRLFAGDHVLELDPVDLFLLEAIRKFAPCVYSQLPRVLGPIVCPDLVDHVLWLLEHKDKGRGFGKAELDALVELAPVDVRPEIRKLLEQLFPQIGGSSARDDQTNEWIRDARICHHLFFETYFRMAIPRESPTQQEIYALFQDLSKSDGSRGCLRGFYEKFGLNELLLRIQCHRNRINPEHLPKLLAEIWALDDLSAKAAGIERHHDTRQDTEAISRLLLKDFCDKAVRVGTAVKAMHDSDTLYPLARLVSREFDMIKDGSNVGGTAFDSDQLADLRIKVLGRIQEFSRTARLLENPDSSVLLFIWSKLESIDTVRAWLDSQISDPGHAPAILTRFIQKSVSSGREGERVIFFISRKPLQHYFNLDALESILRSVSVGGLPRWEKFAVQEALKRINEKKQGIEEAEYPDHFLG